MIFSTKSWTSAFAGNYLDIGLPRIKSPPPPPSIHKSSSSSLLKSPLSVFHTYALHSLIRSPALVTVAVCSLRSLCRFLLPTLDLSWCVCVRVLCCFQFTEFFDWITLYAYCLLTSNVRSKRRWWELPNDTSDQVGFDSGWIFPLHRRRRT